MTASAFVAFPFFVSVEVNMSPSRAVSEDFRSRNIRLTYVHVIVCAAARALARNPELHRMVLRKPGLWAKRCEHRAMPRPVYTPVWQAESEVIAMLLRWGWLLPFGFLRRALAKLLFRNAGFRIHGSGTLQVSVLNRVKFIVSPMFSTSAALFAGGVQHKGVASDGQVAVRPMMTLAGSADHRVRDTRAGGKFAIAVREILQSDAINPIPNSFGERVQEAKAAGF